MAWFVKVMTAAQTPEGIKQSGGRYLHHEDKTALGTSEDIVSDGAASCSRLIEQTEFTLNLYGVQKRPPQS